MKCSLIFSTLLFFVSLSVVGNTDLLLKKEGSDLDFSKQLTVRTQLELDDPFLIQLYSSWKALGALENSTNNWMNLVFAKNYKLALLSLDQVNEGKVQKLKKPAELYLLFRNGYFQAFLDEWITYTSKTSFLNSELGLALDQVVSTQGSQLLLTSGFFVTDEMAKKLEKTENVKNSELNFSLQAFKALKTGENALRWIGKLKHDDELRLHLAHSALLSYGKEGKLGASGKLIKQVVEPWIIKSEKVEEISLYYMTLARLLYQAKAYGQAGVYYNLVPHSSRYFMEARTEYLWVLLQERNFSQVMGELASLKLSVFDDVFYPEIYLASAIGHTMLCQFNDAKNSIHRFVKVNKQWARRIEEAKAEKNPVPVRENFYSLRMRNQVVSLKKELKDLKKHKVTRYSGKLEEKLSMVNSALVAEAKRQWENRAAILDSSLYKLRFVRIELLSRMRALAEGLKDQIPTKDMVKTYASAPVRRSQNEMVFPHDGMLWGDEIFNMSAEVRNECIRGKFYEKN